MGRQICFHVEGERRGCALIRFAVHARTLSPKEMTNHRTTSPFTDKHSHIIISLLQQSSAGKIIAYYSYAWTEHDQAIKRAIQALREATKIMLPTLQHQ